MANYYCTARSNYFPVKDAVKFDAFCAAAGVKCYKDDDLPDIPRAHAYYAIFPEDNDHGGFEDIPLWNMEGDTVIDETAALRGIDDKLDAMLTELIKMAEVYDSREEARVWFLEALQLFVADGGVAVLTEVGAEKSRYLTAFANIVPGGKDASAITHCCLSECVAAAANKLATLPLGRDTY